MIRLIGVTPRSRRAAIRRVRASREKQLAGITQNLVEYQFLKEEAAQNARHETRMQKLDNKITRNEKAMEQMLKDFEAAPDVFSKKMEKLFDPDGGEDEQKPDPDRLVPNVKFKPKKPPGIVTPENIFEMAGLDGHFNLDDDAGDE